MGKGKLSPELFDEICEEIANSDRGLVSICKDKGLNANSFYEWIAKDADLGGKYARARELQAEYLADQIIELASEERITTETIINSGGENGGSETTIRKDNYNRTRLEIDARKWKASKLAPKKYGDKIDLTSGGEKLKISFKDAE